MSKKEESILIRAMYDCGNVPTPTMEEVRNKREAMEEEFNNLLLASNLLLHALKGMKGGIIQTAMTEWLKSGQK